MLSTDCDPPSPAISAALPGARPAPSQRILVFDSGLGGLTVLAEVVKVLPGAEVVFAADDAVFPYGRLSEAALVDRVMGVMHTLIERHRPDVVVVACHTASTLVLPPMRARWPTIAIVGTVPAIKPAAALSVSRRVSVLATPGTVARQYTHDLVKAFAGDCRVDLVGSVRLAGLAEAAMRGEPVADAAIQAEIAPAFVAARDGSRTDVVVLACTHYPLLLDTMKRLASWPVAWVDPAPAIARRVLQVANGAAKDASSGERAAAIPAFFTSGMAPAPALRDALARRGLAWHPAAAI